LLDPVGAGFQEPDEQVLLIVVAALSMSSAGGSSAASTTVSTNDLSPKTKTGAVDKE
jgi:hypothetical protein